MREKETRKGERERGRERESAQEKGKRSEQRERGRELAERQCHSWGRQKGANAGREGSKREAMKIGEHAKVLSVDALS
eukprot:3997605-Pleurochrysis_carterae.AAC.1